VHERLVKYYVTKLRTVSDYYFTLEIVKSDTLDLESSSLPPINLECNYESLDCDVCFMIDSEIRLKSVLAIYTHVCANYLDCN